MKIILLSGGSGKRLWPLSNDVRAKQFLKLLQADDGTEQSMIQRVCHQLDSVNLLDSTYIVTNQNQVEMMKSQIDDHIPIILEPNKRDTFPAIVLASVYLYSKLKVNPNEIVSVLPVDPFVENEYFQLLKKIPQLLQRSNAQLALLGATPKYPSVQYGYIVPKVSSDSVESYYHVESFVEKPDVDQAEMLIRQQALWNCGVFTFPLSFIISYLEKNNLPTDYDEIYKHYERLPKTSFDIEIVEKTKRLIVVPYNGVWEDIGNWGTITNHIENPVIGMGEVTKESSNTHLINELAIPIHVVDVNDVIVAAGQDGILVADKNNASKIKQFIKKDDQRAMYEEKRWGSFRVLDLSIEHKGMKGITKKVRINSEKNISLHSHQYRQEIWAIISGTGEMILNDTIIPVQTGSIIQIPKNTKHSIKANTTIDLIEIQLGTEITEEDITRYALSWEEAVALTLNKEL